MNLVWTKNAWEDYLYWKATDIKIFKRINALIKDIRKSPFSGIGKPEPLKFELTGKWSRRINDEHRLVYAVMDKKILDQNKESFLNKVAAKKTAREKDLMIYQCRYHYN